jgi:hypothetical protein
MVSIELVPRSLCRLKKAIIVGIFLDRDKIKLLVGSDKQELI